MKAIFKMRDRSGFWQVGVKEYRGRWCRGVVVACRGADPAELERAECAAVVDLELHWLGLPLWNPEPPAPDPLLLPGGALPELPPRMPFQDLTRAKH